MLNFIKNIKKIEDLQKRKLHENKSQRGSRLHPPATTQTKAYDTYIYSPPLGFGAASPKEIMCVSHSIDLHLFIFGSNNILSNICAACPKQI
jgi:hypothetical protein